MSTNSSKKTHHEDRIDEVVTASVMVVEFYENNKNLVFAIAAGIIILIVGAVFYSSHQKNLEIEANDVLSKIETVYEAERYREALDGTSGKAGLLSIANDFGGTLAGNRATYFAANALFSLGDFEDALSMFEDTDKDEDFMGAGAYAGEAAVYAFQEKFAEAAKKYERAARIFENEISSPGYFISAGQNYEKAGNFKMAVVMYEIVKDQYTSASVASKIDVYLARAQANK